MKHIHRILQLLAAILAPLSAWADMAVIEPWSPPNNYQGFLYRNGYYDGLPPVPHGILHGIVFAGLPIVAGLFLLTWVFCHFRRCGLRRKTARWLVTFAIIIIAGAGFVGLLRVCSDAIIGRPPVGFGKCIDTEEHRAEYDRFCVDSYINCEQTLQAFYDLRFMTEMRKKREICPGVWIRSSDVPVMREGASSDVTNAWNQLVENERMKYNALHKNAMQDPACINRGGE